MSEALIEKIAGEATDLALHVDLCQQRYLQLIAKFDTVDVRLDQLTEMVKDIKTQIETTQTGTLKTYLGWAGFIIVTLTGALGVVIGKLI